jgi:uncharacterized protein YaiE (UPF0345 family)
VATLYRVNNGASAAAAANVKVTTGTAIKTMLQVLQPSVGITVVEWGISFDGSAAATPIEVELCHTTTVAATVTAAVANDVTCLNGVADAGITAAGLTLSTTGTGYTSTGEGSVVAPVRSGDLQLIAPTNQYVKQFPLGQGFYVPAAGVLRIRVTAGAAVSAYCYVVFGLGGD